MTNNRNLCELFRYVRWQKIRQRVGRIPLVAAAVGVAAITAVPVSQAWSGPGEVRPDQAAVVDVSAAQGESLSGERAAASAAGKPDTAKVNTPAAKPAETKSGEAAKAETKPAEAKKAETTKAETKKAPPARLELYYQYRVQTTGWYCGPAATLMALSARGIYPRQDDLAGRLGTTVNGTNSSADIARVLNAMTKTSYYQATSIPKKGVTKQLIEQLRADVVRPISESFPMVANIAGAARDVNGNTHSFPGGHYVPVVGYQDNGKRVKIADSADPNSASYWMDIADLANWTGTRGYAS